MVNSFYDPELDEGCAFEELISFHGGMGGPQTEPFLLPPRRFPLPDEPIVGAEALHRVLKGWRAMLQGGETGPAPALPGACAITWLGHATVADRARRVRLVTDPCSRGASAHLRRMVRPGGRSRPASTPRSSPTSTTTTSTGPPCAASIRSADRRPGAARARSSAARWPARLIEVSAGRRGGRRAACAWRPCTPSTTGAAPGGRLRAPALGYVIAGSRRVYFPGDTDIFPAWPAWPRRARRRPAARLGLGAVAGRRPPRPPDAPPRPS